MSTDSTQRAHFWTTDDGARYLQGAQLGRGGFATTFLATRQTDGVEVVLKVLHSIASDEDRRRFAREFETMRRLSSERIVKVLGANLTAPVSPFIVMEYVEGCTLAAEIDKAQAKGIPLPRPRARAIALESLRALAECHAHRSGPNARPILHRDVTPWNIMLVGDAENASVKLIDFGLCRVGSRKETVTGNAMGTPTYFAPEAFSGSPDEQCPATDVFSAAIVLYDMLTAGTRAERLTPAWFQAALQPDYDPKARLKGLTDVPAAVLDVLATALASEPRERHADAGAMLTDLERAWPDGEAPSPCAELANVQWELLAPSRGEAPRSAVTPEQMTSLRAALEKVTLIVQRVEREGAEVRRRLLAAIEVLEAARDAPREEGRDAEVLSVREEYAAMLHEMCRGLPEREFLGAEEQLNEAVRSGDVEFFREVCGVIRGQVKVAARRKQASVDHAWIATHVQELRARLEGVQDQARSARGEVAAWHEEWKGRLGAWEQQFRAEAREFNAFAAMVSRLQSEHIERDPDRLREPLLKDEILMYTKPEPDDEMKKLYRAFIRRVHPDLARTPEEEIVRHVLASRLNLAYDARDLQALKDAIYEITLSEREGDEVTDDARFLLRLLGLRRMLRSCADILDERERVMASALYGLWSRARSVPGIDPIEVIRQHLIPARAQGA